LFLVNFCMDFQCLFITARLLHRRFFLWRTVLCAALGATYAVAALFFETSGVVAFFADLGVCFLMCVGSFHTRREGILRCLLPFGLYFGVSFAVGGVMSGMASLLSHVELPIGSADTELSSGAFCLLAAVGGGLTFFWGVFCKRRASAKRAVLRAVLLGRELRVECMVDTANLLRDPVSGRPVVILSERAAARIFPTALLAAAVKADTAALALLPSELSHRVRLLPAATVTGGGMLMAVAPDLAWVDRGKGEVPCELLLAPASLSVSRGDFEALLPAEFIA